MYFMKNILLLVLVSMLFVTCSKDSRTEAEMIDDFISENGLEGEFMDNGIFVSIENPQNGTKPTLNNTVETHYEGKYASDGKVFDSSLGGNPISFPLTNVIVGWQLGIPYFGIGDKGWLVIPANLAYGSFPPSGVRSDAPMAFYIELISIK